MTAQKERISRTIEEYIRIKSLLLTTLLIKRITLKPRHIRSKRKISYYIEQCRGEIHYNRSLFLSLYLYLALKHSFEGKSRLHPPERVARRTQVSRKELHRKSGMAKEVEIWNGGRHEV